MVIVTSGKVAATARTSFGFSNEHAERAVAGAVPDPDEGTGLGCVPEESIVPAVPQPAAGAASSANPAADRVRVNDISCPCEMAIFWSGGRRAVTS
jgi:hypothetical protein